VKVEFVVRRQPKKMRANDDRADIGIRDDARNMND
jgi:hypothetical protein